MAWDWCWWQSGGCTSASCSAGKPRRHQTAPRFGPTLDVDLTTVGAPDTALCDFTVSAYIDPMARPRSFDPNEALDLARDVFWRKGLQGTSLDDITAATSLAKPSLYAAFGDKNALFLKVLDRYHERIVANAERALMEGPSARDAIERWLAALSPSARAPREPGAESQVRYCIVHNWEKRSCRRSRSKHSGIQLTS